MKTYTMLFFFALPLLWAVPAQAQVPASVDTPLVNQYIEESYAERSPAWWSALGRQLTLLVDRPHDQIDEAALQNIIFFATHFGDKVMLNDAAPNLVSIYREHEDARFRIMALVALHAMGDADAMRVLYRHVREESDDRLRRMTVAALNDHYRDR